MKSPVALTVLFLLAMSVGCGEKSTPSGGSQSSQTLSQIPVREERDSALTTLNKEVADKAMQMWKLTKIGESYYMEAVLLGHDPDNKGKILVRELFELRKVRTIVDCHPISEADRLNGIEWKGQVRLYSKVMRCYVRQGGRLPDKTKTWSAWGECHSLDPLNSNSFLIMYATKTNGKWESHYSVPYFPSDEMFIQASPPNPRADLTFRRVDASDLPK